MQVKKIKSFTLIEVIVISVIIGIGTLFLTGVVITGKVMLKQAQNKAAAMSRAHLELGRWTARSYQDLDDNFQGNHPGSIVASHGKLLAWNVTVNQRDMGVDSVGPPPTRRIPYQEIQVDVNYDEDTLMRNIVRKRVSLTGFVPYPSLHIDSAEITDQWDSAPSTTLGYQCVNDNLCTTTPPGPNALAREVTYEVDKEVTITYNIAIDIINGAGLIVTDALRSRVFIVDVTAGRPPRDTWDWYPIIAETPIMSQVSINGRLHVSVDALGNSIIQGGRTYLIGVEWHHTSAAAPDIRIRRANLIVQAAEPL